MILARAERTHDARVQTGSAVVIARHQKRAIVGAVEGHHDVRGALGLEEVPLRPFGEREPVSVLLAMGADVRVDGASLIAVAFKAKQASRGTIRPWGLRLVVAVGVAAGISLGTFRIVTGTSLVLFIAVGYLIVLVQTFFAPKPIIPLAYDSGGVTTSSVTVPLVTALGLGLSATIPGRNPALDGFGLIAFASLFPMITVMGYAQLARWWARQRSRYGQEA